MTKKILLADDSITIRKVVGIIFATEDYQVEMTDNGDDAYRMAQSEEPDLVIADVSMPGKDGFELCRAIKSSPELAGKTSVMLLPGAFDHFDEGKAQDACADGWLTKPFESQALLDKVAQALASKPLVLPGMAQQETDLPVEEVSGAEDWAASDEEILELGELDDLPGSAEEASEADDIWDSVSFDDDLQDELSSDREGVGSFAADVLMDKEAVAEPVSDFSTEDDFATDLPVEPSEESFDSFASEESASDPDPWEAVPSEPAVASAAEAKDFTAPAAEDLFVEEGSDFTEFETTEGSFADAGPDFEATTVEDEVFEEDPFELLQDEVEEEVAVELTTESIVAEEEPAPVFAPAAAFEDDDDEVLDLSEDDILEEVSEESDEFLVDDEDVSDFVEEPVAEEVAALDAAFDEPPVVVEAADTVFGEESIAAEELPAEDIVSTVDDLVFEDEELASAPELAADEEPALAGAALAEETDGDIFELPVAETSAAAATVAAAAAVSDEFVDGDADEELAEAAEDVTEPEPVAVASVAAAAAPTIEEQLQALPEAELKEVVAKAAAPIIEKMAAEMLEKVIWEVVPDLAEVMIREEISKIKDQPE